VSGRAALALAAALLAAGCAPLTPPPTVTARPPRRVAPASPVALAQARHEWPTPTVAEHAAPTGAGPAQAVRAFALAYINWSAPTVSADMAALARRSIGQARSAMELAAAQTAQDGELQRGGVANRGTVEAVAPLAGRTDSWVVVTREQTTATATDAYQGLAPAWHVAVATVAPQAGGWVVSGWQPES
jgi:hypothetical protein